MERRQFVRTLTAAAGAFTVPQPVVAADRLHRIGLELYSVRKAMGADPERTLAAIRRIGYAEVELLWSFDNFGRTPAQVRKSLDREGLRAPSAHIAPEMMLTGWDRALDTAAFLRHESLIVPSLPGDTRNSLEAWRVWAERFNVAGSAARRRGLWLAFHNEPDHMKPIDGRVPYDLFVTQLDASTVRLQLDVGNMLMGGRDPMEYLARYRDRYWSFHLKDVVVDHSRDTELGTGVFDFKRFLAAVPALDRKPCYVEQEGPADEVTSARANYRTLQALRF